MLLKEKAVTTADARKNKIALAILTVGFTHTYVMYDAGKVTNTIDKLSPTKLTPNAYARAISNSLFNNDDNVIIATMTVVTRHGGKKWKASEVEGVAAEKGYGPLLYDIVMAMEDGLTPDRNSVSDTAAGVWDYYKNKRQDVEAKPFDDIDDPLTPPKVDDAELHLGGKNSSLNYAYFIDKSPAVGALLSNHESIMKKLRGKMSKLDFENALMVAGDEYFDIRYRG